MKRMVWLVLLASLFLAGSRSFCGEKISKKVLDLMEAAKNGDIQKARELINKGIDVNIEDGTYGKTPLMWASGRGQREMCEFLLSNGAEINHQTNPNRETALMHACHIGNKEIVEYLISKGADINLHDLNGSSAFGEAAEGWRWEEVAYIRGVRDNLITDVDRDEFIKSAQKEKNEILKLLIEKNGNAKVTEALLLTAGCTNYDGCKILLDAGAKVNYQDYYGYTALIRAGSKEICELLIQKGADINTQTREGLSALNKAAKERNWDMLQFLMSNGADPNIKDRYNETALYHAASAHSWESCRLLLSAGADPQPASLQTGKTALFFTVEAEQFELCELLLSKDADPNITNKEGDTPLLKSIQRGNKDIMKLLISRGANVNAIDKYGRTPLWYCLNNLGIRYKDILSLLLEKGADINFKDKDGKTLLFSPRMEWLEKEIVEMLISAGIDVNAVANDGTTALIIALRGRREDTASLLINAGANFPRPAVLIQWGSENNSNIEYIDGYYKTSTNPLPLTPGTHKITMRFNKDHIIVPGWDTPGVGWRTTAHDRIKFDAVEEGIYVLKTSEDTGDIFYYGHNGMNIKVSY